MVTQIRYEEKSIEVPDSPVIDGLTFRSFRGEDDFPAMLHIIDGSREADQLEWLDTLEDLRRNYSHLINSDPYEDMLFAQVHGTAIGYSRVWWHQIAGGPRIYGHFAYLLPEWRNLGIRTAMVRYNERRIRSIAAQQEVAGERFYESWASDTQVHWVRLLESEGYRPVRYGFFMVRPSLDDLPPLTDLPASLEVRPVDPKDYRRVWLAAKEAFQDHWGYSDEEWAETNFASWQENPNTFQPHLWQVAWAGDEIAGMVLNFINHDENRAFNRRRGYTETICVRRPWRRMGLARALLLRSLAVHKAEGMTETALGVDTENPNGALQLYLSVGYQTVERNTCYRKPLDAIEGKPQEQAYDRHSRASG